MGRTKEGNANAQRNDNVKKKDGFPKVSTFAEMQAQKMRELKQEKE
ncbi:hypothetical protein [Oikeobacillus pervagus]|nr:hypothetical protein [Oikeobacillus pervagus]